jgi:hypothetical protein
MLACGIQFVTEKRGFAGKQYFMTQQGQALRIHFEALLLSFNTPTYFAENCLLLAGSSRQFEILDFIPRC